MKWCNANVFFLNDKIHTISKKYKTDNGKNKVCAKRPRTFTIPFVTVISENYQNTKMSIKFVTTLITIRLAILLNADIFRIVSYMYAGWKKKQTTHRIEKQKENATFSHENRKNIHEYACSKSTGYVWVYLFAIAFDLQLRVIIIVFRQWTVPIMHEPWEPSFVPR